MSSKDDLMSTKFQLCICNIHARISYLLTYEFPSKILMSESVIHISRFNRMICLKDNKREIGYWLKGYVCWSVYNDYNPGTVCYLHGIYFIGNTKHEMNWKLINFRPWGSSRINLVSKSRRSNSLAVWPWEP